MQKGSQNSRILGKVLQGNQSIGLKAGAMFLSIDTNYLQDFFALCTRIHRVPESIGIGQSVLVSQLVRDVPEYLNI